MVVESFNIGMEAHDRYAHNQSQLEQYAHELSPDKAGVVASHTTIQKLTPDVPRLVTLMRLNRKKMWANFETPKNFFSQRRASSYVAPSLGNREKLSADRQRVTALLDQNEGFTDAAEQPGQTVLQFLADVQYTNDMTDDAYANMKRFVQG